MATSRKRRTRSKKKKTSGAPLIPSHRKQEVLGLILMVLAFLMSLAFISYTPSDNGLAEAFSLEGALHPRLNRADNALGLVGAKLAYWFVPNFLGYASLLLTGLLFAWGYVVFRRRTPVYLPLLTVLTLVGAFVVAGLLGWFGLTLETDLSRWSGLIGLGTAGWMQGLFGTVGSFILLLLLLAVTVLLVIDHDIQRSLDRVEEATATATEGMRTWWDERKAAADDRRAERAKLRQERQQAREQARREKEQARASAAKAAPKPQPTAATAAAPAPARSTSQPPAKPAVVDASPRVNDLFRDDPAAQPKPDPKREPRPEPVQRPAPATASKPAPPSPEGEPSLTVQERVQEERTDDIEREADVPLDEDLPYEFPTIEHLDESGADVKIDYKELEENKQILLDALETYKIQVTDIKAIVGPTVTMYELTPAPGVKISRITALEDDLAMAMAAKGIRMIAPIPGKSAIGVEIPNRNRELVRIRDMIGTAKFRDAQMELPVILGKTIEGEVFLRDLTKMPHLLIAGATGAGKSVGLNCLVAGLLYACHPANLKFVMIDPKKIELQQFARIVDHFGAMPDDYDDPIITDVSLALGVLKSCEKEMEMRYDLLAKAGVRALKDYNKRFQQGKLDESEGHRHLPYIVVIVDELADLMMTAGKDIEGPIARLAQMARAVGIHLVLATQRPSVDVITGLIKANFPARIAYQVATKVDSRTILDRNGAQGLVGNGDMLYMIGSTMVRLQGPFISVDEVDNITYAIAEQPGNGPYTLPSVEDVLAEDESPVIAGVEDTDDLFEDAARIIVRSQQGSVSLLQRKLSVGYTRAARMVDQLEEAGIVGPFEGSKARKVLVPDEAALDALLQEDEAE